VTDPDSIAAGVKTLETLAPQAVFIPDTLENTVKILEARMTSPALAKALLLGPALWDDLAAVRGFAHLLDGATYVTPFFVRQLSPTGGEVCG